MNKKHASCVSGERMKRPDSGSLMHSDATCHSQQREPRRKVTVAEVEHEEAVNHQAKHARHIEEAHHHCDCAKVLRLHEESRRPRGNLLRHATDAHAAKHTESDGAARARAGTISIRGHGADLVSTRTCSQWLSNTHNPSADRELVHSLFGGRVIDDVACAEERAPRTLL